MILRQIDGENFLAYAALSVKDDQRAYLDRAVGILARGYAYRGDNARVWGLEEQGQPVGLALVRDLREEPACYDLQQFMIDGRFQGRGLGSAALEQILELLDREGRFPMTEVCVKRENAAALRLFEKQGFQDSGYTDPDAPDCVNLVRPLRAR